MLMKLTPSVTFQARLNRNPAQVNFSSPWENVYAIWQHLLLMLLKILSILTLPNLAYPYLTLPNQLNIPFPNPVEGYLAQA